jgi:hypothetical protein
LLGLWQRFVHTPKERVRSEEVGSWHSYQLIDVNKLMVHQNIDKRDTNNTAIWQFYMELVMKQDKVKTFKFWNDIDLKIISSIKAKDAVEARELIEQIPIDEILKYGTNDVSTIEISNWI